MQFRKRPLRTKTPSWIYIIAVLICVPFIILQYLHSLEQRAKREAEKQAWFEQIKSLELTDIKGEPFPLEILQGKPVILYFWSFDCQPCRREINQGNMFYRDYEQILRRTPIQSVEERPYRFYSINVGDSRQRVLKGLKDYAVKFPVLLDPKSISPKVFKFPEIPSIIVLDEELEIFNYYIGPKRRLLRTLIYFANELELRET